MLVQLLRYEILLNTIIFIQHHECTLPTAVDLIPLIKVEIFTAISK